MQDRGWLVVYVVGRGGGSWQVIGVCWVGLASVRVGRSIVGLNVALKGPFPLVGESKLSRESEMSRSAFFYLL
jgi:hypothetical protein